MIDDPLARPPNAKRRRRQIQLGIVAGIVWILLLVLLAFGLGFIGDDEDEWSVGDRPTVEPAPTVVIDPSTPVGLVAEIRSSAEIESPVRQFDYVYEGQKIPLEVSQGLMLVYFDSCREEDLSGGQVVIGARASDIDPQGRKSGRALSCRPSQMMLPPSVIKPSRQGNEGPFEEQAWRETTVVSFNPVILLPPSADDEPLTVTFTDAEDLDAPANWSGVSSAHYLAYPSDAPRLTMGHPYSVEAKRANGQSVVSYFSVESDSGVTLSIVNDFVVLAPFDEESPASAAGAPLEP